MVVTKETLRAIFREFGGLEPTDDDLDEVLANVQAYVECAEKLRQVDVSSVLSSRLLRAQEGV